MNYLLAILISTGAVLGQTALTIVPQTIQNSQTQTFIITCSGCSLKGAQVEFVSSGFQITNQAVSSDGAKLSFVATTAAAVRFGLFEIPVVTKSPDTPTVILGTVPIEVTGKLPSPIPPGIDAQVDVMWKVLPFKNVADSFGKKVANQYYAIEVVLGNNTGYPLQLASVGFECVGAASAIRGRRDDCPPIPTDAYNITRSTIERERETGGRAIILNTLTAATNVFSVMGGFFTPGASQVGRLNFLSARDRYSIFLGMLQIARS